MTTALSESARLQQLPPPDSAENFQAGPASPIPRLSQGPIASSQPQILTQQEVDEKPWKYIGYKGYTEFLATENDFLILRRFAAVSTRIALLLQHQVSSLEDKLDHLDWKYSRREEEDVNSGSFRHNEDDRLAVLNDLRLKLLQYNEFILQQAAIKEYPNPAPQDIRSLEVWHWNHQNKAISEEEQAYLYYKRDLFSLVPREKAPLRKLLDRSETFRIHWLWKNPKAPELPKYDTNRII